MKEGFCIVYCLMLLLHSHIQKGEMSLHQIYKNRSCILKVEPWQRENGDFQRTPEKYKDSSCKGN